MYTRCACAGSAFRHFGVTFSNQNMSLDDLFPNISMSRPINLRMPQADCPTTLDQISRPWAKINARSRPLSARANVIWRFNALSVPRTEHVVYPRNQVCETQSPAIDVASPLACADRLPELSSIPFTALLADFRVEALRDIKVSTGRVAAPFISRYEKEIDLARRSDEPEFLPRRDPIDFLAFFRYRVHASSSIFSDTGIRIIAHCSQCYHEIFVYEICMISPLHWYARQCIHLFLFLFFFCYHPRNDYKHGHLVIKCTTVAKSPRVYAITSVRHVSLLFNLRGILTLLMRYTINAASFITLAGTHDIHTGIYTLLDVT